MLETETEPMLKEVMRIEAELREVKKELNGDPVANRLDIDTPPSVSARVGYVAWTQKYSTAEPTATNRMNIEIAEKEFRPLLERVRTVVETDMIKLREMLLEAKAPYTPGALPVLTDY